MLTLMFILMLMLVLVLVLVIELEIRSQQSEPGGQRRIRRYFCNVVTICDEITDRSDGTLRVIGYLLSLPGRSALTTWIKHGAAAICAATMACILSFDRARDRFVHLELIIVRQFFARADVA